MAAIVLITGANGFLGTYATLLFESLGHRVIPVDINPPSHDLSLLPIKVSSVKLDMTDAKALGRLCKKKKVTHIIHAAQFMPSRDAQYPADGEGSRCPEGGIYELGIDLRSE